MRSARAALIAACGHGPRLDVAAGAALSRSHPGVCRRQLQLPLESLVDAQGAERARARASSVRPTCSIPSASISSIIRTRRCRATSRRRAWLADGDRGGKSVHHRVGVPERRLRVRAGVRCDARATARPAGRRRFWRVAVRRGAPARPFRSAHGVGPSAVRAVASDERWTAGASRRRLAVACAWRSPPTARTTTWSTSRFSRSPTRGGVAGRRVRATPRPQTPSSSRCAWSSSD